MTNWYLNLNELSKLSLVSVKYISSLKPHNDKQWKLTNKSMTLYKKELLECMLTNQNHRCAYCGLSLRMNLVDREHFASKAKYKCFTFEPLNLIASCAYCNRILKRTKDIIMSPAKAGYQDNTFKILHPYLDDIDLYFTFEDYAGDGYPIAIRLINDQDVRAVNTIKMFELTSAELAIKRAGFIKEEEVREKMENDPFIGKILSYKL